MTHPMGDQHEFNQLLWEEMMYDLNDDNDKRPTLGEYTLGGRAPHAAHFEPPTDAWKMPGMRESDRLPVMEHMMIRSTMIELERRRDGRLHRALRLAGLISAAAFFMIVGWLAVGYAMFNPTHFADTKPIALGGVICIVSAVFFYIGFSKEVAK